MSEQSMQDEAEFAPVHFFCGPDRLKLGRFMFRNRTLVVTTREDYDAVQGLLEGLPKSMRKQIRTVSRAAAEALVRDRASQAARGATTSATHQLERTGLTAASIAAELQRNQNPLAGSMSPEEAANDPSMGVQTERVASTEDFTKIFAGNSPLAASTNPETSPEPAPKPAFLGKK